MSLAQWSTTAANNASGVTNVNWAEGQAPSTVNNSSRQEMADVANWYRNTAEFIDRNDSAAFSSAAKIKFTGTDLTGTYKVGRRIFTTSSTPGTLHGRITASSFSTDTTVTIDFDSTGVLSNEAISDVQVGIISGSTNSTVDIAAIAGIPAFVASKQGTILIQNADDDGFVALAAGSSGTVMTSNGTDAAPSYKNVSGVWVTIKDITLVASSSAATVEFEDGVGGVVLDTTHDEYEIQVLNFVPSVDDRNLDMNLSIDGGASALSCKHHVHLSNSSVTTYTAAASAGSSDIRILSGVGNATGENGTTTIHLGNINSGKHKTITYFGCFIDSGGNAVTAFGATTAPSTAVINSITFSTNATSLAEGRLILRGRSF